MRRTALALALATLLAALWASASPGSTAASRCPTRPAATYATLRPNGVVQGAAATDQLPPRISARVLAHGNGKATLAIRAVDPGGHGASGLAGIWWGGAPVGYGGRYTTPVRVPLNAKLVVFASDRAGNVASTSVDVAALASASH